MSDTVDMSYFEPEVRDGFLIPSMMKRFWARNLKAYLALERVCEEQGVYCSAIWGTLLGAVRCGGYIPWDDDIDIEMKHDEYMSIEKLDREESLPEEYWISDYVFTEQENMVRRWMSSRSLIEKYENWKDNYGSPFVAIIDIFLQEYIPSGEEEQKYWEMLEWAGAIKEQVKDYDRNRMDISFVREIRKLEEKLSCSFDKNSKVPLFIQILIEMDKYCLRYTGDNCDRIAIPTYYRNNPRRLVPKDLYAHYIKMDFEYAHMMVPAGYDGILRRYFGNYMVPVTNFGIHGYPAYEAMNEDARKHGGFELSTYRYDAEEINRINEGRTIKKKLRDELMALAELFEGAHQYIYTCLSSNDIGQELLDVLAECQELAITAGENIENRAVRGERYTSLFEEYCEDAYTLYQMLSGEREIDNAVISEKYARMKAFEPYYVSICEGIEEKKEVLFLSSGPESWGSLHTLWKAASDDVRASVHVIAVPGYRKDHSLQIDKSEMVYDTNGYPEEVQFTPYDGYSLEEIHPDVIVFQIPYDEYDSAISVHPYFYSSNLKKNSEKLVLIPPFMLREMGEKEPQGRYSLGTFLKTRGAVLADRIYVQSESIGRVSEEILNEFTMTEDISGDAQGNIDDRKIVAIGLPIEDSGGTGLSKETPPAENTDKRKRLVYMLGASMLYEHGLDGIEKAKQALGLIREHRDDIRLIWYDDPYASDILSEHKKETREAYRRLREEVISAEDTELCTGRDYDRIVRECDAMYGDGCVLMNEFRLAGKPVLWATPGVTIRDAEIDDEQKDLSGKEIAVEGDDKDKVSLGCFLKMITSVKNTVSKASDKGTRIWRNIKGIKTIAVVYEAPDDVETAETIINAINDLGDYDVFRCPLDDVHPMKESYDRCKAYGTQLLITINLAGFDLRNTGGNSSYTMFGCNLFHYIDRDVEDEKERLSGLIPITMKFITDDESRCERLRGSYRRIKDICVSKDISCDMAGLINNLDWRM
ncbi:MAG: LicD family protein [Eubacterium sp.]|nr:LicD family protein [Eubacterium sp.]